jgi:hypothetical protein
MAWALVTSEYECSDTQGEGWKGIHMELYEEVYRLHGRFAFIRRDTRALLNHSVRY